jgi:hypothetical protein
LCVKESGGGASQLGGERGFFLRCLRYSVATGTVEMAMMARMAME